MINKLLPKLRRSFGRSPTPSSSGTNSVLGYAENLSKKVSPKRALVSYLPQPVKDELAGIPENMFSNRGIARTMPKVLNDLGYLVDIISYDDRKFSPAYKYDLLIQHGGINFTENTGHLDTGAKIIYFSTGSYWRYHNKQEAMRYRDFYRRHNTKLAKDRLIENSEEQANASANGIICLGNSETAKTYNKFSSVYSLPIGCYPDDRFTRIKHDYNQARKSFLFFAGAGNIHKGLDLLIDTFKDMPNYTLHICTHMDEDFSRYYSSELALPNIKLHGFVQLRSPEFFDIVDRCNYIVLPSCSEGSPGSVVECMLQGLIPIVSLESHIDVGKSGIILERTNLSTIRESVVSISNLMPSELGKLGKSARKIATTTHSPENFSKLLRQHIRSIIQ